MTLTLGDYCALAGLLTLTVGTPFLVMLSSVKALGHRVATVEDRVSDLTTNKVDKKDWVREAVATRAKVDQVHIVVSQMDSKMGVQAAFASALKELSTSIMRLAEQKGDG